MKKKLIFKDFYQYQFEPLGNRILGQNIYVLFGEKECIIFDAGYEPHLTEVMNDLTDYTIKHVIVTHFHPDHVYGLNILDKQSLIGSVEYYETLKFFDDLDNELLIPTTVIDKTTVIKFNEHSLTLVLNQGHSNCGMLIDIDGMYLLVGDDYIALNNGLPVLPYLASTLETHVQGLKNIIRNYIGYTFLPAHGKETSDVLDIQYRLRYLEFLKSENTDIEEFYKPGDIRYINENWHKANIKNMKKAKQ